MAAPETPAGELGWRAEDFTLKDAYGNSFRLYDLTLRLMFRGVKPPEEQRFAPE